MKAKGGHRELRKNQKSIQGIADSCMGLVCGLSTIRFLILFERKSEATSVCQDGQRQDPKHGFR